MSASEFSFVLDADEFLQRDAAQISRAAFKETARTIVIDLAAALDATTSAFAHLIVLRRWLLQRGRDLRIVGLRARAERVYQVNRLASVLPRA